jgi:uncharacterized protein YbjT (DUF2867 family)
MDKVAIVIGATGLIGQALVEQLANASNIKKIVAITRRPVKYTSPKVDNRVVDFDHLEKFPDVFKADYLFSCLGTTAKQAGSLEAQRKVDVDYQFTAAEQAAKHGVQHYLLVSSTGADENSSNPYLKMKGELEQKVLSLPFRRISIFQPSVLAGERPNFRLGEKIGIGVLSALRFVPVLNRYRPIRGDEVAKKLIQVSQSEGRSPEWFKLDEIFSDK